MAYLTQEQAKKLLGRSLTTAEENAFDEYEAIAESRLANLICATDLNALMAELKLTTFPTELALVLARFVGAISEENSVEHGVESKKVEDFSITYSSNRDVYGDIVTANGATIAKYSLCAIRHGKTLKDEARYYHYDRF